MSQLRRELARVPSARTQENARLLTRIRQFHADSDSVIGSPRIWEDLSYVGERCGRHRIARLMRQAGLRGVPQRRRGRTKPSGTPPAGTRNHLERDFTAAAESFFGRLKRERVNRRQYRTRAEARADIFDYIERWHNPRQRRRLDQQQQGEQLLTQLSVETG